MHHIMQHIQSGSVAREVPNEGILERPLSDAQLTATRHGPQCHVKPPIKVNDGTCAPDPLLSFDRRRRTTAMQRLRSLAGGCQGHGFCSHAVTEPTCLCKRAGRYLRPGWSETAVAI